MSPAPLPSAPVHGTLILIVNVHVEIFVTKKNLNITRPQNKFSTVSLKFLSHHV